MLAELAAPNGITKVGAANYLEMKYHQHNTLSAFQSKTISDMDVYNR